MNKNLWPKIILIIVLVVLAAWTLYPVQKTLKQGIDLAGGTSLIYEIDTFGLSEADKKDLAQKMITVLRRRIDPANIQNLIWRPQGNSRFEIQMPLASSEAIEKRNNFKKAKDELLSKNISRSQIIQALQQPLEERNTLFAAYAQNDPNKLQILENLAEVYDRRQKLLTERDTLYSQLGSTENKMSSAGIEADTVKIKVDELRSLPEQELRKSLSEISDANDNIALMTEYVKTYDQWAQIVDNLSEVRDQYNDSMNEIDNLNLTEDMLNLSLESRNRTEDIQKLKANFPDRADEIDKVVAAYDEYKPFKGRLDDPQDLKRMLKGAGILEFRILPTQGHPEVDMAAMKSYLERLQEQGPEYASDNSYKWVQIEDPEQWNAVDAQKRPTIVGQFGDKTYVLACNQTDDVMLHSPGTRDWKLERAYPTYDERGRRAIGFVMDQRGGRLMGRVTGKNIDRPLCILLDGLAISAPSIDERIPGRGRITGNFSQTQVEDMVNKLNAGSLPARLIEQPISENTIGPSIGADNRDQGIRAGLIGLVAVIACMAIYYCLAGGIADLALLLNILFVLAIMAGIRATFTLPGIAGIILTIGMSVDANVLIFERIREEQQRGSSLRVAIANGYQKAFRTIFDANITTFITAAILYWRASEEVRGFAIVLMLGIASSMFTALFVTRVIFDYLLSKRIIKDHLMMLRLIHNPSVNWMRLRPVFFCVSILLVAGGLFVFFNRNDVENNKYDIEFTGGTSVQIVLAEDVNLTRQQVEDRIRTALPAANVVSVGESGKQYEITTTETNKTIITVNLPQQSNFSAEQITNAIRKAQEQYAGSLNNLLVTQAEDNPNKFVITTSQMNQSLVKEVLTQALPDADISEPQIDEVVNNAIRNTFADELKIQQNLQPNIVSEEKITTELIDSHPALANFLDGIKIECEIKRPATLNEIRRRLGDLQFKPEMQDIKQSNYEILDSGLNANADANQPVNAFVYASTPPDADVRNFSEDEWTRFVENEKAKVLEATQFETSLPRVRQFDPSVGAEQKTRALIAIFLSLFAIVTYIWIRFGNVRYGVAAIIALIHDVSITLGAVAACTYIASGTIGEKLLIGDFKIDLAMIAAFLTLIGYSLNDTIVVFDRIRENRGKAKQINPQTITDSINQTVSRTIMTSFTTFIVVLIMYIFGGQGLRGFTFAIGFGIIIGTYSSIAIAAPILLLGSKIKTKQANK
jgi:SecD/SecF fusion protein